MQLTPVESSHIAAIGYLEAERVLLVRYKDGAVYAWSPITSAEWTLLQFADSKGQWLRIHAVHKGNGILITKGGNAEDSQSKRGAPPLAVVKHGAPLNVIDEDADKCCRKLFLREGRNVEDKSKFICSDCGTHFEAEAIGPNRYWRIVPNVATVRPHR